MTLEDFQIPLRPKVHGARHLHEAFSDTGLDFFLLLSSAVGLIGTGGQANYVAGNTFQDSFATCQPGSKTHFISLNIGMIEDAKVNNRTRTESLRRQGLIPISSQELLAFLEYEMSTYGRERKCKQAVIGFDSLSLSQLDNINATPDRNVLPSPPVSTDSEF